MTDREYLIEHGWKEADRAGVFRWYKPSWRPICYYQFADAVDLERSLAQQAVAVRHGGIK